MYTYYIGIQMCMCRRPISGHKFPRAIFLFSRKVRSIVVWTHFESLKAVDFANFEHIQALQIPNLLFCQTNCACLHRNLSCAKDKIVLI